MSAKKFIESPIIRRLLLFIKKMFIDIFSIVENFWLIIKVLILINNFTYFDGQAVKMMCAVVVMFVFCWLPIQVFNLFVYNEWYLKLIDYRTFLKLYIPVFFGCHFLAMGKNILCSQIKEFNLFK